MAEGAGQKEQPALPVCEAESAGQSSEQRSTPADVLAKIVSRRGLGPPDLTVQTSDDQEFYVHKELLRRRSKFFKVAIDGPFKEAATGILPLRNDPPSAVAALLQFIYVGDYELFYPEQYQWEGLFHVDVYIIGDLYDIPSLIRRATHWFAEACHQREISALSLLLEVVPYLYGFIPGEAEKRGIHLFVLEIASNLLDDLIQDLDFVDMLGDVQPFRVALSKHRSIAAAELHAHILELQDEITKEDTYSYGCPLCRHWMTSKELRTNLKSIYCPACKKIFKAEACLIDSTHTYFD